VAIAVADEAGRLLLEVRAELARAGARRLGEEGDRRSHALIADRIAALRPHDAILSEEGADDPGRLECRRVWIIDPLDGTREYGEPPRDDWAVHVALCVDGAAAAGAVVLPAQGRSYGTADAPRALPPAPRRLRIAVSRSRPPRLAGMVASALDADLLPMGSAGAKAMAILAGVVDIYLHAGGQYEWDSAAPVAVALAAGLHASRLDGSELRYNRPDPYMPDLLICRPELAAAVLGLTGTASAS